MKKVYIPLGVLAIVAMSFTSCKKCENCERVLSLSVNNIPVVTDSVVNSEKEYCKDELDEIKEKPDSTYNDTTSGVKSEYKWICTEE